MQEEHSRTLVPLSVHDSYRNELPIIRLKLLTDPSLNSKTCLLD